MHAWRNGLNMGETDISEYHFGCVNNSLFSHLQKDTDETN